MNPIKRLENSESRPYHIVDPKFKDFPKEWQESAALAILDDLNGRKGVGDVLYSIDLYVREEIVTSIIEIIKSAPDWHAKRLEERK